MVKCTEANYLAGLEEGKIEGRKEGIGIGEEREKNKIIRKLLEAGIKPENIVKMCNYSPKIVHSIAKSINL